MKHGALEFGLVADAAQFEHHPHVLLGVPDVTCLNQETRCDDLLPSGVKNHVMLVLAAFEPLRIVVHDW